MQQLAAHCLKDVLVLCTGVCLEPAARRACAAGAPLPAAGPPRAARSAGRRPAGTAPGRPGRAPPPRASPDAMRSTCRRGTLGQGALLWDLGQLGHLLASGYAPPLTSPVFLCSRKIWETPIGHCLTVPMHLFLYCCKDTTMQREGPRQLRQAEQSVHGGAGQRVLWCRSRNGDSDKVKLTCIGSGRRSHRCQAAAEGRAAA